MAEFPSNQYEALAMLYLQNQDITGKTPEELFKLYTETVHKIYNYAHDSKNEDWMKNKQPSVNA